MNPPSRSVLIMVTHLLGIGHFARMAALGHALSRAGHRVTLISGGRSVPTIATDGITLVQLPPVHCREGDFSRLLTENGTIAGQDLLEARAGMAVKAVELNKPDIVITELYPFGRRALAREFEVVLKACRALENPPAILCSIRDVLNPPGKPRRPSEVLTRLGADYDAVLVHGDPAALPLSASWPVEPALARRLRYTGYLRDAARALNLGPQSAGKRNGIIVSAGGSDAGLALNRAALEAARSLPDTPWLLLVSHSIDDAAFQDLQARAPGHVRIERARPDFPILLGQAALSISQAGYNTVLDLAAAGPRALIVPFSAGQEQEQSIRALHLAQRGLARVLPESELSPARLVAEVKANLAEPLPDWSAIRLNGDTGALDAITVVAREKSESHAAWRELDAVLAKLADANQTIDIWLRDDDAIENTAELDQFLTMAQRHAMPVALASIPARLSKSLIERVASKPDVSILVHGHSHQNHAPSGHRATEFGDDRLADEVATELLHSLRIVTEAFGEQGLPVLVPPWNRIGPGVITTLPSLGYRGLSVFGPEQAVDSPPGLHIMNTHWDPIHWRGDRGLKHEAGLIRALSGCFGERAAQPATERRPIGLLTHHLVHDAWITRFLDALLGKLAAAPAIRFVSARAVLDRK